MLAENHPSEAIVDWAEHTQIVQHAQDRPWHYVQAPHLASESYKPACHCHKPVNLVRYPCEDGVGYVYVGQCNRCQAITWSFLECAGK
jgi:hypothetical protein